MSAIFAFHCPYCLVNAVQLTFEFPNFRKDIPKITICGIFATRKISSNQNVWPMLKLYSKPVITIPFLLVCCLIIVAKPQKISKILRVSSAKYYREIKLASLTKSIKAKTPSLPLFSLALQIMSLTVSNSLSKNGFFKSFFLSVISAKVLPRTASFVNQEGGIRCSSRYFTTFKAVIIAVVTEAEEISIICTTSWCIFISSFAFSMITAASTTSTTLKLILLIALSVGFL